MTVSTWARRYDVAAYYALAASGVLGPDDRVELIEGEILTMSPIGSQHAHTVVQLTHLLGAGVGERARLSVQNPLRLSDFSEPVPDVALLRPRAGGYAAAHPGAADVMLLIEVADTTIRHDRGRKLPLYARFGVPEVWIVVLRRSIVEMYRDPGERGYASKTLLGRGHSLSPLAFPDVTLTVDEILG